MWNALKRVATSFSKEGRMAFELSGKVEEIGMHLGRHTGLRLVEPTFEVPFHQYVGRQLKLPFERPSARSQRPGLQKSFRKQVMLLISQIDYNGSGDSSLKGLNICGDTIGRHSGLLLAGSFSCSSVGMFRSIDIGLFGSVDPRSYVHMIRFLLFSIFSKTYSCSSKRPDAVSFHVPEEISPVVLDLPVTWEKPVASIGYGSKDSGIPLHQLRLTSLLQEFGLRLNTVAIGLQSRKWDIFEGFVHTLSSRVEKDMREGWYGGRRLSDKPVMVVSEKKSVKDVYIPPISSETRHYGKTDLEEEEKRRRVMRILYKIQLSFAELTAMEELSKQYRNTLGDTFWPLTIALQQGRSDTAGVHINEIFAMYAKLLEDTKRLGEVEKELATLEDELREYAVADLEDGYVHDTELLELLNTDRAARLQQLKDTLLRHADYCERVHVYKKAYELAMVLFSVEREADDTLRVAERLFNSSKRHEMTLAEITLEAIGGQKLDDIDLYLNAIHEHALDIRDTVDLYTQTCADHRELIGKLDEVPGVLRDDDVFNELTFFLKHKRDEVLDKKLWQLQTLSLHATRLTGLKEFMQLVRHAAGAFGDIRRAVTQANDLVEWVHEACLSFQVDRGDAHEYLCVIQDRLRQGWEFCDDSEKAMEVLRCNEGFNTFASRQKPVNAVHEVDRVFLEEWQGLLALQTKCTKELGRSKMALDKLKCSLSKPIGDT
jgi:hypothetical protein